MTCAALRIQAVLYNPDLASVRRSIASMASNIDAWRQKREDVPRVVYALGDASPSQALTVDDVEQLDSLAGNSIAVSYRFFGENVGFGKGHNLLAQNACDDMLLFINPDIVFAPHCIERLIETAEADSSIGIVEARQSPIENAKRFDFATGDTDWACGACLLARRTAFERVGGFDCQTFFMYCEDVDLSWAVRHAGYRIVYQPAAIAFHPHRLSDQGTWDPTVTEQYHDALGKLLLARKWGDAELVRRMLAEFTWDDNPNKRAAAKDYRQRRRDKRLPEPIPGGTASSTFHEVDHTTYRRMSTVTPVAASYTWQDETLYSDSPIEPDEPNPDASSPFASIIVLAGIHRLEGLGETLTCLAAQTVDDFEVLIVVPNGTTHRTTIEQLVHTLPMPLRQRIRLLSAARNMDATIARACQNARGLYASVLHGGDLVFDQWIETFLIAAFEAPGSVLLSRGVWQYWKSGRAPIIDANALYCADEIVSDYRTTTGVDNASMRNMPSVSWSFPLFAANELGLLPQYNASREYPPTKMREACGVHATGKVTILSRIWTDSPIGSSDSNTPAQGALRKAIPIEVKKMIRFACRRITRQR